MENLLNQLYKELANEKESIRYFQDQIQRSVKTSDRLFEQIAQVKNEIIEEQSEELEEGDWIRLNCSYSDLKRGKIYQVKKYQGACKTFVVLYHPKSSNGKGDFLAPPSVDCIKLSRVELYNLLNK